MSKRFISPWPEDQVKEYFDQVFYSPDAFLIDEITEADQEGLQIKGIVKTDRRFPYAQFQRGNPVYHPPHVSGPDMVMMTGNLGGLHAYFFHECLWKDGWVGFGNRMNSVIFKNLAKIGPDMQVRSKEIRTFKKKTRLMMEFEFEFTQEDKVVYQSRQTCMFLKNIAIN